jgi:Bacterial capsule synthesis protein PGA_cap
MRKLGVLALVVLAAAGVAVLRSGPDDHAAPRAETPLTPRTVTQPAAPRRVERTRRLTLLASGDLLIHASVFQQALTYGGGRRYDFQPMFRRLARYVRRADLAVCHVETPLTPGPPRGYPVFSTPTSLARTIARTGWDACDTASNHSLDAGQHGIDSTIWALHRAGVRHTGSYRSRRASRRPLILRAGGVRVALLAYTETTNGRGLPRPWSLNLAQPRRILADARRARRRGAQVVLVNVHWGPPEYTRRPVERQRRLVRRLARSPDITAILGQGPHVVWRIRWLRGKPVVFSEGNLISSQTPGCCSPGAQDGLLAVLRISVRARRARVRRADYVPVWVRHPDYTVLPVGRALRYRLAPAGALRASYLRTVAAAGHSQRTRPIPRRLH